MKRCPNCNTQFNDAKMICSKCAADLEPIPDQDGGEVRGPGIDLRKKSEPSSSTDEDGPGTPAKEKDTIINDLLESARGTYEDRAYSDCIQMLDKAMKLGSTEARRLYGSFLDDNKAFRLAVERYRYSKRTTQQPTPPPAPTTQPTTTIPTPAPPIQKPASHPETSGSPSSSLTPSSSTPTSTPNTQEPSSSETSDSPAGTSTTPAGGSGSTPTDPETLFQEGLTAIERGQFDSAFQSFRMAAEQSHAMAQFYLGECYFGGVGVKQGLDRATKWYRQAVKQFESSGAALENPEVMHCLGSCYEEGKGVKVNNEKAGRYFIRAVRQYRRLATEQSDANAMYQLGLFYEVGIGVEKNEAEAVKWYLKAMQQYRCSAEQGDVTAQFNLGQCYDEGKGVDENKEEAVKWYRMAAEQGHDGAQLKLGNIFYSGSSGEKNKEEAVKWYRMAAKQGNVYAEKKLAAISTKKRSAIVFWIILLLLIAAAIIWGIWYTGAQRLFNAGTSQNKSIHEVTRKTAGSSMIKVGFSQVGAESNWRKASTESIKTEAAKRANIELTFSDAQQKQENQIKAIRNFISKGVDVIAFSPVVATGFEEVLKEAKEAGIPVVLFDRAVKVSEPGLYVSLISSNFVEEGRQAARWLLENVGDKNINIAVLSGSSGSAPAIERQKGFEEIIKGHTGIKIIKSQSGDFTRSRGKEVMKSFLKSPEANKINVLFAHNDDMALGAIQAIEEAGKKPGKDIIIISIDGVKTMIEAILTGKANCTVETSPLIGPQLFDTIEKIHNGEPVPAFIPTKEEVFDYRNVTQRVVDSRKY